MQGKPSGLKSYSNFRLQDDRPSQHRLRVLESLRDIYDILDRPDFKWPQDVRRKFANQVQCFNKHYGQCRWSQGLQVSHDGTLARSFQAFGPQVFLDVWFRILYGLDVSPRQCLPFWHSSSQGAGNRPVQVQDVLASAFKGLASAG